MHLIKYLFYSSRSKGADAEMNRSRSGNEGLTGSDQRVGVATSGLQSVRGRQKHPEKEAFTAHCGKGSRL